MSELFTKFQLMLSTNPHHYRAFCSTLKHMQDELKDLELVRSHGLLRLTLALEQLQDSKKGVADVRVLMRQVIRSYGRRLMLPRSLWDILNERGNDEADIRRIGDTIADIEVTADAWRPSWLDNTEEIDILAPRRNDIHVLGDGLLSAMTRGKFASYQSLAQQVAVQSCLFASSGDTLLVTLPTGAGKSHCVLLPAWQASQGGRVAGGTTLVIVPTISLAIDLEKRALEYFVDTFGPEYTPASWTSGTPKTTREAIVTGIRNGTLPILYVSPEALMTSQLHNVCLEAASQGTINWLVVDEAHLIETWGAGFRTDFQFLSGYRKELLTRSEGKVRTLLLSATVSAKCTALLKRLFSDERHFCEIQANRLRSEPSYWFKFSQFPQTREQRVVEALHYLPRPAVLYVSTIEDAKHWLEVLRHQDFHRIAMFTGETDTQMRQRLVYAWSNNELDIMVATSAFGVGIDKSDIRTIIHACLPENIDRFYQEVGRAGRDGCSAVSLLCATVQDIGVALRMTSSSRITYEKGMNSRKNMKQTGIFSKTNGNIQVVDVNSPPADKPEMQRGPSNREWNEHTLLLMQRADLLQIMDARAEEFLDIDNDAEVEKAWLQIRLIATSITAHPQGKEFRKKFEEKRNEELETIQITLKKMENLVREYDDSEETNPKHCIAYRFSTLYPGSTHACGGCLYCRKHKISPYEKSLPLEVDLLAVSPTQAYFSGDLLTLMGWRTVLNLLWNSPTSSESRALLNKVLVELVSAGVQQLLLPPELLHDVSWMQQLVASLAKHVSVPHMLRSINEVLEQKQLPFYPIPTVIISPTHDREADTFYRHIRAQLTQWQDKHVPCIFVITPTLYLESENGAFIDRIDGNALHIADLHQHLINWQEPVL